MDNLVTDLIGVAIMLIGLVSLAESLLQARIIGSSLPMIQGTLVSLFAISFGGVLMTKSATDAFRRLRLKSLNLFRGNE